MNLLLDTNILIRFVNGGDFELLFEAINPQNRKIYVSIVSIGELKSIALKNSWGEKKQAVASFILDRLNILEINENLIDVYAEIDAFSQRRNPAYVDYAFSTPRNMGKND